MEGVKVLVKVYIIGSWLFNDGLWWFFNIITLAMSFCCITLTSTLALCLFLQSDYHLIVQFFVHCVDWVFFLFCQILTTFTVSELLNYSKYQNLHQKTYLVVTHLKEWRLVWKSGEREWKTKSCTGRSSKKNSNWVTHLWLKITKPW